LPPSTASVAASGLAAGEVDNARNQAAFFFFFF
jgi:hypothetical protein